MVPMVLTAWALMYVWYLRKLPVSMPVLEEGSSPKRDMVNLLKNLWSLGAVMLVIITFNLSVCVAAPMVIALNYFVDHFKPGEIPGILRESVELVLLGNMYLIMLFKGIITYSGVVALLPDFFGRFPIPMTLIFGLIFFFGAVISGSQAIIALCLPMAIASVPDGGIPFLVMLMCAAWGAMQISPTHVCSFVAAEFFHTTLGDLVVRLLPVVLAFCMLSYGYSFLLAAVF